MTSTLDLARLSDWLQRELEGYAGSPTLKKFAGGQSNPTYLLASGEQRYVLRCKPPGVLLPSAHAIDREYRVMQALAGSAVPVPRVRVLCEDESVIGTAFYLMEYIEGRSFQDPALPSLPKAERAAIYDEMNRVIASLHNVDHAAVGLADYGRPGAYLKRQIERWTRQYRASATDGIAAMERLIEWLPAHVPDDDETSLVHGDFRIDNLIFHPTEPRVLAVLDWELSTLGHPLADFAYHCMTWRVTPAEFRGLKGHDLAGLGIPHEDAYVRAYCERTGRSSLPDWDYYMAFNLFRMAAILQGILHRALHGSAASAEAEQTGRRASAIAEAGWRQVIERQGFPVPEF